MNRQSAIFAVAVTSVATCAAAMHADRFGQPEEMEFAGKVTDESELLADARAEAANNESARLATAGRGGFKTDAHGGFKTDAHGGFKTDAHGGRIEEGFTLKATGFFRVQEIDGKWWFVTPEGNRFFLVGCDACDFREGGYYTPLRDTKGRPREEFARLNLPEFGEVPTLYHGRGRFSFLSWNLFRKYGNDFQKRVDDVVRRRLAAWGFNSTSKWGWGWKLEGVPYFEDGHIPDDKVYFGGWPHDLNIKRGRFVDMYHPAFERAVEAAAKKATGLRRGDPDLIAYSLDNENGWNPYTLGCMLKAREGEAGSFARRVFFDFVAKRRGVARDAVASADVGRFSSEERDGFMREASLKLHRAVTAAYRRFDPDHMVMAEANSISSSRAWIEGQALSPLDFIAMHEYNHEPIQWYASSLDFMRAHGKPFAILEFSFTGEVRGMAYHKPSTDCVSEKARGLAYRHYTENAVRHPLCLGLGYFLMYDQPFTMRGLPGESHHFGLVSQQDRPYYEMLEHVRKSNDRLFALHSGEIAEPFTLDDFTGVLRTVPCMSYFRKLFMPKSIPANVTCECNTKARVHLFDGNASHLKINSDTFLDDGVNWFGTIDLSGKLRGRKMTATFYCWNGRPDSHEWPVFEAVYADGTARRVTAERTLDWKGKSFKRYKYVVPGQPEDCVRLKVGIDVRDSRCSWAALLSDLR